MDTTPEAIAWHDDMNKFPSTLNLFTDGSCWGPGRRPLLGPGLGTMHVRREQVAAAENRRRRPQKESG